MSESYHQMKLIWGVTILLALVMVGGAYFYAQKGRLVESAPVSRVVAGDKSLAKGIKKEKQQAEIEQEKQALNRPFPAAIPEQGAAPQISGFLSLPLPHQIKLSSPAVRKGVRMVLKHTCYRDNVPPQAEWSGAPKGTKSFALFFVREDQDNQVNWAVFNIPGTSTDLSDDGLVARNSLGNVSYVGPCEPKGSIPYGFYLFALDQDLALEEGAPLNSVLRAMDGHILDVGVLKTFHMY